MNTETQTPTNTVIPIKSGDSIVIIGRKWFDKSRGSTYFSAVGLINGIEVVNIPYDYGYENHYVEQVFKQLRESGYITNAIQSPNQCHQSLSEYCKENNITLYYTAASVSKRKDL